LKLEPDQTEDYVEYLLQAKSYDEAARRLVDFLNNDRLASQKGKSKHDVRLPSRNCALGAA